jgi:hypothetical protein
MKNLETHYQNGILVVNTVAGGWTAIHNKHILAWHWSEESIDIHVTSGTIFTVPAIEGSKTYDVCSAAFVEWSGAERLSMGWR